MQARKAILVFVWLIGLAIVGGDAVAARPDAGEAQYWMGEFLMPNAACPRMQFVVKFHRADAAAPWAGSLSIPRGCGVEGAIDMPLSEVAIEAERLHFVSLPPPSENEYEVKIEATDPVARGRVMIGRAQRVELRMWRVSAAEARDAAPVRPQTPAEPRPYVQQAVSVPAPLGAHADWRLTGTLTLPAGEGAFTAVVLVGDSEAHNRDHEEGTHKPFLVLADQLTRAGYAVLRCDDRGIGGSSGEYGVMTMEEAAADVASQVRFLAGTPKIDTGRIGVLGRGEGSLVASLAAGTVGSGVAFAVLMAPAGHRGMELAALREEAQLKTMGEDPEYTRARVERLRAILELARTGNQQTQLKAALADDARAYSKSIRGMGVALTEDQVAMWSQTRLEMFDRARFRSWLVTDPIAPLRKLRCPVLVVVGELDMLMPPKEELPLVCAALEGSGKPVEVKVLARTNHWMQPCATGFNDEYDLIETTVSEEAVKAVVGFLGKVTE